MINPNRIHRSRAVITKIGSIESKVKLPHGHEIIAWTSDIPAGLNVGDAVNIQARYSIMLDQYVCKTVRKIKQSGGVK
jgi:hypothetical protein